MKLGDVVQLNSGGPKMTVSHVDERQAVCRFFDGQGELDNSTFPIECLKPAGKPAKTKTSSRPRMAGTTPPKL